MPEWLLLIIKSFVVLVVLFAITKIVGKRQLRELTYIEYIVGITVGSLASEAVFFQERPFWATMIPVLIFGLFPYVIDLLSLKSKTARDILEGGTTVVVKDGKILEDNLKKENLTIEDLMEQLRLKNVFKVADVEFATLESNGEVSLLLKAENQPLTPKMMKMKVSHAEEPQAVIMDGVIMDEPLATAGYSRGWLDTELKKAGVTLENVFLAQVDKDGQLYLDVYDDKVMLPPPQTTKLTYVTLKKCQADLELYALATKEPKMQQKYTQHARELQYIINLVEPELMR